MYNNVHALLTTYSLSPRTLQLDVNHYQDFRKKGDKKRSLVKYFCDNFE